VNNIAPINKGIQVLEKGTNFLSGVFLRWLQSVESRLNRAVVTDENGNIAYGGATIPSDVDSGHNTIFLGDKFTFTVNPNGIALYALNAYVRNDNGTPRWQYIGSGPARLDTWNLDGSFITQLANDNGGKLPNGSSVPWYAVYRQDTSGNINIKTGSTYTATL